MCISRDDSIRGGTEENDPGTGERLGMLVLCSVNTSSQSQPDQCRYSNKEEGYYKINWTDSATIVKVYSYNEKKDKYIRIYYRFLLFVTPNRLNIIIFQAWNWDFGF